LSDRQRKRLGEIIAERRKELGLWRQRDLADSAGVGIEVVNNLENGRRFASDRNIYRIEVALDWSIGAMERIGRGGDPTDEDIRPSTDQPVLYDEIERKLWVLPLPVAERRGMIVFYRMQRELNEGGGDTQVVS
jgi:transcriptional regulator with XRE-family HTH domain